MSTVSAYAATSATEPLIETTITRRDVGPHDVAFDIHFAGICHSDIHTVKAEWGDVRYPLVPGHEIAGIVTEIGSEVTKFKVGDRVGVGCFVDSCRECASAWRARSSTAPTPEWSAPTAASAATASRPRAAIAARSSSTRTMCCTSPTACRWTLPRRCCAQASRCIRLCAIGMRGPDTSVAVVGLGGLGHMGVKLAHAMGAKVTVLSQSLKKMEDGLRLGADEYYATSDPDDVHRHWPVRST